MPARTHGQSSGVSSTYTSWLHMRNRCNNPNNSGYVNYGGRGITVCAEWFNFEKFLEDMGERPEGLTLDRIDTDGNYCKENCRWANGRQQALSRRNTRISSTGVTGVNVNKKTGKFEATVSIGNRQKKYLGLFLTVEEASAEIAKWKKIYV